jgi:2'-5' RNA ligase
MFMHQERTMDTKEPPNKCTHKTIYSSLQYNLPTFLARKIVQWGYDNIPDDALFIDENDPSYGRETKIHCTILGGINTSNIRPLYELFNEPPFTIRLGNITCFQNCKFDVVKIDVIGGDLYRLNQQLKQKLDVTETYSYYPHITIAYVKQGTGNQFVGSTQFNNINVYVNALQFFGCNDCTTLTYFLENRGIYETQASMV